eukprot:CAMPEP_0202698574 /NCGR_PEP_ID=MMETSP1385-20130828/11850_1 /ASSEMBLY_ACC=CAM_ASM_000861 /TAXON_ID=933848 /ORGANISM="Elphidium margaritaceum" /LENGTH=392 /DNA_ID=CAMNT_0049355327 /DNA_START=92 /DNA_END=1270 /DNA_ORIENTATION=-
MVWLITILFALRRIESAPVADCNDQYGCLKLDVSEPTDDDQYEICLYWDSTLASCDKSGGISHACSSQDEADKIETFQEGRGNAMCNTVDCGGNAIFGLKDGKGCGSSSGSFGFSGVSGIYCQGSGGDDGFCGGGNTKECMWVVPAPECATTTTSTTTTTTTSAPESTTTTSQSTTSGTSDETTTVDDEETTTTTIATTTTITTEAPATTSDCIMFDEGCGEFISREDCDSNPLNVACMWDEGMGLFGQCALNCGVFSVSDCVAACGCKYEEVIGCYPDVSMTGDSVRIRQDVYDVSDAELENGMTNDDAAKPVNTFWSQWIYIVVAAVAAVVLGVIVAIAMYCVVQKRRKTHRFDAANVDEPDAENAIEEGECGEDDRQLIIDTTQATETR